MEKQRPPWARYLGGTFTFSGLASELHKHEKVGLRLYLAEDGGFSYATRMFDGGQAYTMENMEGKLCLPTQPDAKHDFVLEVEHTTWQSGSWNGENSGENTDVKRFVVWAHGEDAMFVDTKLLTRDTDSDAIGYATTNKELQTAAGPAARL